MDTVQSVPDGIITFPMFGDKFAINVPMSFNIFGLPLYWYGFIIALGFLLAYFYCNRRVKDFGLTQDNFIDALLFAVPSAVIGARLYYVVFNFSLFKDNFWSVFNTRSGGLAIYGAIIFAVIAVLIYCKAKKTSFGAYFDLGAFGLLIGQTVGRWGNFINREAFGRETDIFCRMGLTDATGKTIYVHPTFLYESLWNILGLLLLHLFSKSGKRRYDGQIFAMYVAWYGFGRMLIEGLRTDSLYLFNTGLRVSQVLAGASVIIALAFLAINGSLPHNKSNMLVNVVAAADAKNSMEAAEISSFAKNTEDNESDKE
ncbi:MAG: prolipoprotein diacylglyceryl transferase [Firmicutes bacterium HGW-Firmicutes-16]|nr:MAG: prolipoprotein diacylglyceryl transferase [Firmicutes bacterium HGW-Firmicutes-16]